MNKDHNHDINSASFNLHPARRILANEEKQQVSDQDFKMSDIEDMAGLEEEEDEVNTSAFPRKNLLEAFGTPSKTTTDASSNVDVSSRDHSDHMKVYLRIRPFTTEETEKSENQGCMEVETDHLVAMHAPKDSVTFKNSMHGCGKQTHKFTFSNIFAASTTQKAFFDQTALTTVKDFVDGQNCLVFTYGVTNSGKTYTVQGNPKDGGILPRALDVLFNSIQGKQWDDVSLKPKMFSDVYKLTPKQMEMEERIKESVMKMASEEEPDVTSLLGDDVSDMSKISINSTAMSEDSLAMTHNQSQESTTSNISSILPDDVQEPDKETMQKMFEEAENRIREEAAVDVAAQGQIRFSVWVSFAEVYNEYIYDLLEPLPNKKNVRRATLNLREDKNGSPYIKGLKCLHVTSADEAYKVLTIGKKNLQVACTKLNHNSSRSHCIFTIKVLRVVDKEDPRMARVSMLSFCDLAGSERYTKTQNSGERLKEAGNINTSLLTLGRCIAQLRYNQSHKDRPHVIPFRDSKLTRLFQSFFSGKGKASMVVNVNQCASMFDETLHVLKFSAIAKQVTVVQEPEKRKPVSKRVGKSAVSLALNNKAPSRESISWATPGTLLKLAHLEEEAVNVPIPEGDEDFDETDEPAERELELMDLVESLKQQLCAEKKKTATLEVRIRQEVCKEFAEQLVEIENNYSERLREEQMMAEEKAERRIEMYTQSVKKTRKRPRIFQDEEEELVSSVDLHKHKVRIEETEKESSDLRKQLCSLQVDLDKLQETVVQLTSERDAIQQENSKVKFELADAKKKVDTTSEKSVDADSLKSELDAARKERDTMEKELGDARLLVSTLQAGLSVKAEEKHNDTGAEIAQQEIMANLKQQLADAKEHIAEKSKENDDLNEMLTEAGETFQQREAEINQLKQIIEENEQRMEQQAQSIEELQKVFEESKEAMETANSKLGARDNRIVTLEQEMHSLKESLSAGSETATSEGEIGVLKQQVASLEECLSRTEEDYQSRVKKLEDGIREHKSALNDNETFVADLNKQLKEMTNKYESEKASYERAQECTIAAEEKLAVIEAELTEVKLAAEKAGGLVRQVQEIEISLQVEQNERVGALETVADLEEKVSVLQKNLQACNMEVVEREKDLEKVQRELAKEQADRQATAHTVEKLQSQVDDLRRLLDGEESGHKASDMVIAQLKSDIQDLMEKLAKVSEDLQEKEDDLHAVERKLAKEQKAREGDKETIRQLEDKVGVFMKSVDKMKDKDSVRDHKLADLTKENERLQCSLFEKDEMVANLSARAHDLETSLHAEKVQNLSQLEDKPTACIEELNSKAQSLIEKVKEAQSGNDEAVEKIKCLQATITELEEQLATAEEQNFAVPHLKAQIKQVSKELDAERKENAANKSTISSLQSKLEEVNLQLKEAEVEINASLDNTSEIVSREGGLARKLEHLKTTLATKMAEHEDSQRRIAQLEGKVSGLEASLEASQAKEEEMRERITKLEASLAQEKQAHQEADDKVETLESKILGLEASLEMSNEQDTELAQKVQKLSSDLHKELNGHSEAKARINELQTTIFGLELSAEKASGQANTIEELGVKVSGLQSALDLETKSHLDSRAKLSAVEEEVEELKSSVEKEKKTVIKTEKQVTHLEQKVCDLNDTVAQSKKNETQIWEKFEQEHSGHKDTKGKLNEMKSKVMELEEKLSEAQQSQTGQRQLRRQKSEMEQAVAKLGESLKTSEQQVLELEGQLKEQEMRVMRGEKQEQELQEKLRHAEAQCSATREKVDALEGSVEDLEVQVKKGKKREKDLLNEADQLRETLHGANGKVSKLEEVVKDLERCLASSKASESRTLTEVDELRGKFHACEKDARDKEDLLHELENEVATATEEIQTLKSDLSSEKSKLIDLEAELAKERENSSNAVTELSHKEERIVKLEEQLQSEEKKLEGLEGAAKKREEEIQTLKADLAESKNTVNEVDSKLAELENQREEDIKIGTAAKKNLETAQEKLSSMESNLANTQACDQEEIGRLSEQICDMETTVDSFKEEISNLKNSCSEKEHSIKKLSSKLEESQASAEKAEATLKDLSEKLSETEATLAEKNTQITEVSDNLKVAERKLEEFKASLAEKDTEGEGVSKRLCEKEQRLSELTENLEKQEKELENIKQQLEQREEKLQETESSLGEVQARLEEKETGSSELTSKLQSELEVKDKKVEELEEQIADVMGDMEKREASIKSYNKQTCLMKEEIDILNSQAKKASESEAAAKQTLAAMMNEAEKKDGIILELRAKAEQKSQVSKDHDSLTADLQKTQERESTLRTQLQEASKKLEEQNVKFNMLEDRFRLAQDSSLKHEKALAEASEKLEDTQKQQGSEQERLRSLEKEKEKLQREMEELKETLRKKEERIKTKNSGITELMEKMDLERGGFEIALKDAKSNEQLVETLKDALEGLDSTLAECDNALESRKKDLRELRNDHEELLDKYDALLVKSKGSEGVLRKAERRQEEALKDKMAAEAKVGQLQSTLAELGESKHGGDAEKAKLERIISENNEEMKELERLLSESRKNEEVLKSEQENFVKLQTEEVRRTAEQKEAQIKSLGLTLREKERAITRLEREVERVKSLEQDTAQMKTLEEEINKLRKENSDIIAQKEVELKEWRENRDKLVSGLEMILKKKDVEIKELKKVLSNGEGGSAAAAGLETQLKEKETLISKLEAELRRQEETIVNLTWASENTNRGSRSTRGRGTANSTSSEAHADTNLKAEIDTVQQQLEQERQKHNETLLQLDRLKHAKEEIILDLKESNRELLSQLTSLQDQSHLSEAPASAKKNSRRTTRGRRKRKSDEGLEEPERVETETKSRRTTRGNSRRKTTRRTHLDENEEPINETNEDIIDLDEPVSARKRNKQVLSLQNSPGKEPENVFVSPKVKSTPIKEAQQEEKKRKKRLFKEDVTAPFDCPPPFDIAQPKPADSAHQIVTRKLRSRRN